MINYFGKSHVSEKWPKKPKKSPKKPKILKYPKKKPAVEVWYGIPYMLLYLEKLKNRMFSGFFFNFEALFRRLYA